MLLAHGAGTNQDHPRLVELRDGLAAAGEPVLGLVLYAYPLHPPGKPENLRADHLPAITAPMLFFQGTRDPLSRMELFDRYVRPLPGVTVELLEADHSLGGARNAARLIGRTAEWIETLGT